MQYKEDDGRFDVQTGETWLADAGKLGAHHLTCGSISDYDCNCAMDVIYYDPPWDQRQQNRFSEMGGVESVDFREVAMQLTEAACTLAPVVYVEVGNRLAPLVAEVLASRFRSIEQWVITYGGTNPCRFYRAGDSAGTRGYDGLDEAALLPALIDAEWPTSLGDVCFGRGLAPIAAHKKGVRFIGNELSPRRMAITLQKLANLGCEVYRMERS